MNYPVGQVLAAPVVNGSANDLFGTHIDYLGVGGYRVVAALADRDAIPTKSNLEYDGLGSGMRRHLMLVAVQETGLIYILYKHNFQILVDDATRLVALKDNNNWLLFSDFLKDTTAQITVSGSSKSAVFYDADASAKTISFLLPTNLPTTIQSYKMIIRKKDDNTSAAVEPNSTNDVYTEHYRDSY